MGLHIVPTTVKEANTFVKLYHRHHKPVPGHKFSTAVEYEGRLVGVAIVGRPVARILDDGFTVEVNRLCTDGTYNACSILYATCRRVAKELGYKRIITYTLPEEGGSSLRASGWTCLGLRGGGNWNVPSRPRNNTEEMLRKQKHLWECILDNRNMDKTKKSLLV